MPSKESLGKEEGSKTYSSQLGPSSIVIALSRRSQQSNLPAVSAAPMNLEANTSQGRVHDYSLTSLTNADNSSLSVNPTINEAHSTMFNNESSAAEVDQNTTQETASVASSSPDIFASFNVSPQPKPIETPDNNAVTSAAAAAPPSDIFASFGVPPQPKTIETPTVTSETSATAAQPDAPASQSSIFASFGAPPMKQPEPKPEPAPELDAAAAAAASQSSIFASFGAPPMKQPEPKPAPAPELDAAASQSSIFASFGAPQSKPNSSGGGSSSTSARFLSSSSVITQGMDTPEQNSATVASSVLPPHVIAAAARWEAEQLASQADAAAETALEWAWNNSSNDSDNVDDDRNDENVVHSKDNAETGSSSTTTARATDGVSASMGSRRVEAERHAWLQQRQRQNAMHAAVRWLSGEAVTAWGRLVAPLIVRNNLHMQHHNGEGAGVATPSAAATNYCCEFAVVETSNGSTNMVPNAQPSFALAHVLSDNPSTKLAMQTLLEELRACALIAAQSIGPISETVEGAVGLEGSSARAVHSLTKILFTVVNLAADTLARNISTLPVACLLATVLNEEAHHEDNMAHSEAAGDASEGAGADSGANSAGAAFSAYKTNTRVVKVEPDALITAAAAALASSASKAMAILVPGGSGDVGAVGKGDEESNDYHGDDSTFDSNVDDEVGAIMDATAVAVATAAQHSNQGAALECCLALYACGALKLSDECRLAAAAASRVGAFHLAWLQAQSAITGKIIKGRLVLPL
jgi:hypothetical protein